jgi:hypothetical protein
MADPTNLVALAPVSPHWTAYLTAISTPLVAIVAAFVASLIAYRQWRTSRNRLKLDLFKQRHEIYLKTYSLLSSVMTSGTVTDEQIMRFVDETRSTKWLLSDDAYLHDEIYKRVSELASLESELKALGGNQEAQSDNINKQRRVKASTAPRQRCAGRQS